MARWDGLHGDLEVLPLGEAGLSEARRSRRWPWPKVVVALAVLAAWAGLPLRTDLAVRRVKVLDRRWQVAQALDREHKGLLMQLSEAAVPGDEDRVARARAEVLAEAAARNRELLRRLPGGLPVDPRVSRLRQAIAAALERRVEDLETAAEVPTLQAMTAANRAESRLAEARRQWDVKPAGPPAAPLLRSGRTDLAALAHYIDVPTGGVGLVVADADGLHRIDLDRSRSEASRLNGVASPPCDGVFYPTSLVVGRDYLAFVQCHTAHAAPLGLDGQARQLGPATAILASLRPEAVWLVAQKGPDGEQVEVTEVDGGGSVLTPTWRLPRYTNPVAAVRGGLLLQSETRGIEIWDPARRILVRRLGGPGLTLAFQANMVAWISYAEQGEIRLTNLTSDATLVIRPYPVAIPSGHKQAAFSPDGSHLAVRWQQPDWDERQVTLGVVDVASGAIKLVSDASAPLPALGPLVWSPDGRWVFFGALGNDFVSAYRLDSSDALRARLRFRELADVVAI